MPCMLWAQLGPAAGAGWHGGASQGAVLTWVDGLACLRQLLPIHAPRVDVPPPRTHPPQGPLASSQADLGPPRDSDSCWLRGLDMQWTKKTVCTCHHPCVSPPPVSPPLPAGTSCWRSSPPGWGEGR